MTKIRNLLVALGMVAGLGVAAVPLSSYAVEEGEGGTTTPGQSVGAYGYGEIAVDIGDSISIYTADLQGNFRNWLYLGEVMNNGAHTSGYYLSPVVTTNATTGYNLAMSFGFGTGSPMYFCDYDGCEDSEEYQQFHNNNSLRTKFTFDDDDAAIPAVGENGKIQPGVSAWGYKLAKARAGKDENGQPTGGYTIESNDSCDEYSCWKAMPPANQSVTIDTLDANQERDYQLVVYFGVSANATQPRGRYTGGVLFTATAK